jgi:hypothetical protein
MSWLAVLALTSCASAGAGGAATASSPAPAPMSAPAAAAGAGEPAPTSTAGAPVDNGERPAYAAGELAQALAGERARLTEQERQLVELEDRASDGNPATRDDLVRADGDLRVRRRFAAMLDACTAGLAAGDWARCPPRLDEPAFSYAPEQAAPPALTAKLRFDRDSWRVIARELHGRACACRTLACVDGVDAAIDWLETRPMHDVLGDDAATASIVRARECLGALRGKRAIAVPAPVTE